jgi:hypothetical protein
MASSVGAQRSASDISDAQIAEYKRSAETGCQEGGKKKGDAQVKVDAFCGCLIETLSKTMTPAEWRQVVLYSRLKQDREEMQALAPHLKAVEACRPQS